MNETKKGGSGCGCFLLLLVIGICWLALADENITIVGVDEELVQTRMAAEVGAEHGQGEDGSVHAEYGFIAEAIETISEQMPEMYLPADPYLHLDHDLLINPECDGNGNAFYTVVMGDNLYILSIQYGVTSGDIMQLNGKSSSVIHVGDVLRIPYSRCG